MQGVELAFPALHTIAENGGLLERAAGSTTTRHQRRGRRMISTVGPHLVHFPRCRTPSRFVSANWSSRRSVSAASFGEQAPVGVEREVDVCARVGVERISGGVGERPLGRGRQVAFTCALTRDSCCALSANLPFNTATPAPSATRAVTRPTSWFSVIPRTTYPMVEERAASNA